MHNISVVFGYCWVLKRLSFHKMQEQESWKYLPLERGLIFHLDFPALTNGRYVNSHLKTGF